MKRIEVEITGISPLLMARFSEEAQEQLEKRTSHAITKPSPEVVCERAAYRINGPGSNLYIQSEALFRAIRDAAGLHKINRRSAKGIVTASVGVSPERIDLDTNTYATDRRSGVNHNTNPPARVMLYRPRLDSWRGKFILEYEEDLIQDADFLRLIVEDAGRRVGIGAFRPERGGRFGRFVVTGWKLVK